jgi:hypothetical protein
MSSRDLFNNKSEVNHMNYGIMHNGFIMINLMYSINEYELDIIDTLLKKYKKLWLAGRSIKFNIPEYITHLCLDVNCEMFVDDDDDVLNKLPASLEFLSIMVELFNEPLTNLPPNLKHLEIHSACGYDEPIDFLPSGLETLILDNICDSDIITNTEFPPKLKILIIVHGNVESTLRNLPTTLEYLHIHADKGSQEGIKDYIPNVNIIYH